MGYFHEWMEFLMSLVQGLEEQTCVWGLLAMVPELHGAHLLFQSTFYTTLTLPTNAQTVGGKTAVVELRTTITQRAKGMFSLRTVLLLSDCFYFSNY